MLGTQSAAIRSRTKYSREIRENLRKLLGAKCARCDSQKNLQFDCIVSPGGAHHELNWRQRLTFYGQQHAKKNLQLLCPTHHVEKTLDEIAARHFSEARVVCPCCKIIIKVSDQLRAESFEMSRSRDHGRARIIQETPAHPPAVPGHPNEQDAASSPPAPILPPPERPLT